MDLKELKKGDIVLLFGSKVKLVMQSDCEFGGKMVGYNAKLKPIKFTKEQVSKVSRKNEDGSVDCLYFVFGDE